MRVDQRVAAVRAMGVFGLCLESIKSEMTKSSSVYPFTTVQGTSPLPTSQLSSPLIFTFPPTADQYLKTVQSVRHAVCRDKTVADGETAGRLINDVTEGNDCEGKPDKFR